MGDITEENIDKIKKVYINRLYGLLCEREKGGSWKEFLDKILVDTLDYCDDKNNYSYYKLIKKLTSLRYLSYEYFRATIFDCIKIVKGDNKNELL